MTTQSLTKTPLGAANGAQLPPLPDPPPEKRYAANREL